MNSVLNPEAPEFHPLLTSAVQDGFLRMNKTIKTSNCFPVGKSYDIYKTYPDFGVVTYKISKNVVLQSKQIVQAELPEVKLECISEIDDDNNTEKIIDVNESLLDRININIDTLRGDNKPSEKFLTGMRRVSSWNSKPVISKIQVGDATFIGAKNIPRPQLCFKDNIDNSYSLWVPKISDKPNNIKPLALNILYNADGMAVGYEHPYSVELDLYHPPPHALEPDASLPKFPLPFDKTPLTLVDTEAKLDALVKHLQDCDEIAVDVEHHSHRSYQGITCLIQITTYTGGDFIIDTLAIREHVHKLNNYFTDPKKVKVFHGADNDVKWLQRDFGIYIVGLFDTFQAGKLLKLSFLSLKNLLASYCDVDADKKYQLADWRIRPLPEELIEYARMDTHYLLYIWRVMKRQLLEKASGAPTLLISAFENSRHTSCLTYNKEVMDERCHIPLYVRSKKSFNSQQLAAFKMLYKWRDAQARELDEGPSYLIPHHMLLALAETLPRELQGVKACCVPMPPFVKLNMLTIHRMILSCRELPIEPALYQPTLGRTVGVELIPSYISYNPHDLAYLPDYTEEINLEMALELMDNNLTEINGVRQETQPDVAILATDANLSAGVVSTLNADAKMFIPPYERYKCFRKVAQIGEMKEYRDKEAKVAALSRDNELIKTEVLHQLQTQRDLAEGSLPTTNSTNPINIIPEPETDKTDDTAEQTETENDDIVETTTEITTAAKDASQRKRKMDKAADEFIHVNTRRPGSKKKGPQKCTDKVKSFHYKNVNYKKFYCESDKGHKQPKMKFKKP